MQEIEIVILVVIGILAWTSIFQQTFNTKEGFQYKYLWLSLLLIRIDVKPINCSYCLSFWTGLILSIVFLDLTYMSVFLFYVLKRD